MTPLPVDFTTASAPWGQGGEAAFSAMRETYGRALRARPDEVSTTRFVLAGAPVSMRIVGSRLAALIGASFRHLFSHSDVGIFPRLTIDLWDERAAGIGCPRAAREAGEMEEARQEEDAGTAVGAAEDRYVGHLRPGIRLWMDRHTAHVVGCVTSSDELAIHDRGKPLYFPLLLWHADQGVPVIHAALVSTRGGGALFVGKGGMGKTTAALACLLGGLGFLGDDYIGLEQAGACRFIGHSLYDSVWLTADGEARFPALVPYAEPTERSSSMARRLLHVFDAAPDRLGRSAPIRAVVATTLSTEPSSSLQPASQAAALLALAPSSMLRLPVSGTAFFERMSRLVEHVQTYELAVGLNATTLVPLVRRLLELEDPR